MPVTGTMAVLGRVCLVLALVLHVLDPGTARAVVGVLVRALAPGSCLVVTAGAGESDGLPESVWPGKFTADDLGSLLAGLDLVPPGIQEGRIVCATGLKAPAAKTTGPAKGLSCHQHRTHRVLTTSLS